MEIILLSINLFTVSLLAQNIGSIRRLADPSKCLDLNTNNDNIYLHSCHTGDNQRFELGAPDSDGYYTIKSKYNNKCLDVHAESNGIVDAGDNIYTHECHTGDNQKFRIEHPVIRNKANGQRYCIDTGDSGWNVHIVACNAANGNQRVMFVTDEILTIEAREIYGKCLELNGGDNDNVYLQSCHGESWQQWRRSLPDDEGYHMIISAYNGECLDANPESNGVVDAGDNIYTSTCHGGDNQQWSIGNVLIRSKAKGNYCLDAGDTLLNVHIVTCSNKNNNQRFSTEILSTSTCSFHPYQRNDCGFGGITSAQCTAKGCCYDETYAGVPWCFYAE